MVGQGVGAMTAEQPQQAGYEAGSWQRVTADLRAFSEAVEDSPRKRIAQHLLSHLRPLQRFVRRELRRWTGLRGLAPEAIAEEEVLDTVILRALDRATEAPERGFWRWLRGLVRREIRRRIDDELRRLHHERSLEEPVGYLGDEWPDQVVRLLDILADPTAALPEDIVVDEETRRILEQALDRLPERWREVFLLRAVDGWDVHDIAQSEGVSEGEVERIVQASRIFLADVLREVQPELT